MNAHIYILLFVKNIIQKKMLGKTIEKTTEIESKWHAQRKQKQRK